MAVELAEGWVTLVPSARGFTNKIQSELGGPLDSIGNDAGDRVSKGFVSRFTHGLGGIAVAVGAAFAAVQIGGFLKDAITQASDLNESVSKVGVVFGDSAGEIQSWAKTAAKSLGQSNQQALEAAGTFGNLFVSMKIGAPQAAKMSKAMVNLAGDLASFNNVSPEEALDALRSGLVGETEPLRRFGVNLNEATLKAKALELGLSDGKATLDASAKAQASYALILEQTGTAQGDFARTSGGLANQQRILAAQFLDLKAKIGTEFQPAAVAMAKVLTEHVVPALADFVDWVGPKAKAALDALKLGFNVGEIGEGFLGVMGGIGRAVRTLVEFMQNEVPNAIHDFTQGFKDAAKGIDQSDIDGKLAGVGAKLGSLVDLVKKNPDVFKPIVAGLTGFAAALASIAAAHAALGVLGPLGAALGGIGNVLPLLISPVGLFAIAIGALAAAAFLAYQKIQLFRDAVDSVVKAFKDNGFKGAVDEAGVQMGRLWEVVKPKLEEFVGKIGPWLEAHGPAILEGLKSAWVGFATWMSTEFWPFLAASLGVLLSQFGGWIVDTAAPWLRDKLVEWAHAFAGWVAEKAVPWLLEELPILVGKIGDWIIENKPLIEAKLIEWANAFVDWIQTTAVPWLNDNLPLILQAIADFIVGTVLPQLGIFARDMALALITFAVLAAAQMPGELAKVTIAVVTWATELTALAPTLLFNAGLGLGRGLISGLASALSAIGGALAGIGQSIVDAVIGPIRAAWNRIRFTIPSIDVPFFGKIGGISIGVAPLAAGAVVSRPTFALIGEGRDARTNPEIVAPESTIARVMEDVLSRANAALGNVTINISGAIGGQDELTGWIHGSLRQYEAARK